MKYKKQTHIYLFVLIGLMAASFISCEKKAIQFGSQFVDNPYTQIIEEDTITPIVSTVYIDSFATSNTGVGIIGHTIDPKFGTLTSSTFLQLGAPPFTAGSTQYDNSDYDSITLVVKLNKGSWYGDTTKPIKLNVYQLTDNITFPAIGTTFYNTDNVAAQTTPMASFSFTLWPNTLDSTSDTLSIRLPDELGRDLFAKLQSNDINIQSNDNFTYYFKGLKIAADPSSNMSLTINDSVEMRLYYSLPGFPQASETHVTFGLYNGQYQFNNVAVARTGSLTPSNFNSDNNEIISTAIDSTAFLQPLANAMIKLTFPTLQYLQQPAFVRVAKATLYIKPVPGTFEDIFAMPQSLTLTETDMHNGLGGSPLVAPGVGTAQTGSLAASFLDPAQTGPYYTYDLTAEVQSILADPSANINKRGLLLVPSLSSMFTTFNRLLIGDGKNTKARMQLVIDYISVK
ncbi:MAG TPA: DUF4270 family protein [Arachidicoccus sp.]